MHAFLLLGCVVFATSDYIFGSAHMMIDDRLSTNKVTMFNSLSRNINPGLQPPVVINWQNLEGGREQRRSKRQRHRTKRFFIPAFNTQRERVGWRTQMLQPLLWTSGLCADITLQISRRRIAM
ncbi:agouti signaling protein 1 isoform X7 [Nerophis ophidion]|uniref:agouti signaling protein 1 isoform X7 n=1 Tax=Nerophis ophidion TaxID=159077 RepID=UPI002ADFBD24|nr:agouti signaling protein 1 isoform X7 [Nerophis ophidion]